MTFGAVLHKELLWDFSFSVLGHGIITQHFVSRVSPLPFSQWDIGKGRIGSLETRLLLLDCRQRWGHVTYYSVIVHPILLS